MAPTVHLTVSYSNVVPDNLPLWIAKEGGIFKAHGLDVDLQLINSTTGMPALLSGQTQFADIGGSEALSAAAAGGDVVVLANLTPVAPYVFYSQPAIPDVAGLKGKKVGITSPGGSADIATQLALKQLKLDPARDVAIVNLGSVPNVTAGMLNGAVQASVAHPPESSQLVARGFHPLLDLAKQRIPFATTTVVAKKSYIAANKGVVQRYVDSVVQGIAREKKDRALAVRVLEKYYKSQDATAMGDAYDYYAGEVVQEPPYSNVQQFSASQSVLGQKSEAARAFDLSGLFDNSFVRSAANRGVAKS